MGGTPHRRSDRHHRASRPPGLLGRRRPSPRGDHEVAFFALQEDVPRDVLERLSAFVVKRTRPASVRSLVAAEKIGIPTGNSAIGVMSCVAHLVQLRAFAQVGFSVPECSIEQPDGPFVAKSRYHWGPAPSLGGEGGVSKPRFHATPVDYEYYAVDTGEKLRTTVIGATSKLHGEKRVPGEATPVPAHSNRLADLLALLEMRGLGVDFVGVGEERYAVDLNPCPSFEQAGLVEDLVGSIEACPH